ncbi:MAG TPA: glucose-6-phosphate isomerase [Nitrospiraceae bacterium]|nr:glucose-6-phosphate isomerase [Nitrospiraceae bacterium]
MAQSVVVNAKLGVLHPRVDAILTDMAKKRIVARLWAKDHRLWKPTPAEIENRLGWLAVAEQMEDRVGPLTAFAKSVCDEGFRHVVLLGMGGSSLGPEVLRRTFPSAPGFPRLIVLDSTVPGAVREVSQTIHPARTLFILASKSGGTIEVMSLFAYFWRVVSRAKGNTAGNQFLAITDPGTSLSTLAHERGFRTTFVNPPDIGGRYSVLSYFGLVPAALIGLNVETLIERAVEMGRDCGPDVPPKQNPGAYLGAAMAGLAREGRDKVTIVASPAIATFGLWAEQLLAESTGKEGKGLIPIAQEPPAPPSAYGDDRLFVYLRVDRDANERLDQHAMSMERAGHPVIRLRLRDRYDLGAEFFRWEFATAAASHYLGIHPFDQPNVQESKENTARILKEVQKKGRLPSVPSECTVGDLLAKADPGSYLAVLSYLKPSAQVDAALRALRKSVMARYRLATTAGYGPRYLHSTGQLHKGGPAKGLFLQLVGDMTPDLPVPDAAYTFGTLAQAQAVGDLQSLEAHGRPVARVDLTRNITPKIKTLLATNTQRRSKTRRSSRSGRSPR